MFGLPRLQLPGRLRRRSEVRRESDNLDSRDAITRFLFVQDPPEKVDFAFVLGSPSISSVEPAIALYAAGLTSRLVVSGHGPNHNLEEPQLSEAEVYRDYAKAKGVRAEDILIETEATNTLENFRFSHPIINRHLNWNSVRAVSISGKPFHMRRALMTARAEWPPHVRLVMLPSSRPDDPPAETWWQSQEGRKFVLHELRAIGTYGLKGELGGF